PTIKVQRPLDVLLDETCPLYVNTEKRPWLPAPGHPRRAAVSAFGFGGSNFHAVLEEADPAKEEIDWTGEGQLIALCAEAPADLMHPLGAWPRDLAWEGIGRRADRSRRDFRIDAPCRLVLVVERDRTDVAQLFANARGAVERPASRPGEGIFFGAGPAPGELAVLFPGQGAQ